MEFSSGVPGDKKIGTINMKYLFISNTLHMNQLRCKLFGYKIHWVSISRVQIVPQQDNVGHNFKLINPVGRF